VYLHGVFAFTRVEGGEEDSRREAYINNEMYTFRGESLFGLVSGMSQNLYRVVLSANLVESVFEHLLVDWLEAK
jgi:hypothetical protein